MYRSRTKAMIRLVCKNDDPSKANSPSTSGCQQIISESVANEVTTTLSPTMEVCPVTESNSTVQDISYEIPLTFHDVSSQTCPVTGNLINCINDLSYNYDELPTQMQSNSTIQDISHEIPLTVHDVPSHFELCPVTGNFINCVNDFSGNDEQPTDNFNVLCETSGEWNLQNVNVDEDTTISVTQKVKKHQKKRALGQEYIGYVKKDGKYRQIEKKSAKLMRGRCQHKNPKSVTANSFCCQNISDDDRSHVFKKFWSLRSWVEKKAFFNGLVLSRVIKKRRSTTQTSPATKKMHGYDIYLFSKDGIKHKVCQKFFINTLAISHAMYVRWSSTLNESLLTADIENTPPKKTKKTDKKESVVGNVKQWLDLLPKVPSHYCRRNSNRKYVESTFLSKSHMLSVYNTWCVESNLPTVGRNVFTEVLKSENISIHKPRKDQCDICIGFKLGTTEKQVFEEHIIRKEQSTIAKKNAKESANDTTLVLTMDLQSVLLCPKLMASAVYYKQKLQLHNFTLYSLNNADVTLYAWHEADGGVTANEFTSCIIDYLKNLSPSYKKVILISDGCNYQNRNKVLASALSDYAKQMSITIEQLFLEKGHTMMEADNVHSVLEHYFKPPIFSPSDYISRMKIARPKHPYVVKNIHFDFFLNYDALLTNLPSLRPGKRVGDPVVTDLRALKYSPSGDIFYKIDVTKDWLELQHRRKSGYTPPLPLYNSPIPLSESKFRHLQELKMVIDKDHHPFYNSLTHL